MTSFDILDLTDQKRILGPRKNVMKMSRVCPFFKKGNTNRLPFTAHAGRKIDSKSISEIISTQIIPQLYEGHPVKNQRNWTNWPVLQKPARPVKPFKVRTTPRHQFISSANKKNVRDTKLKTEKEKKLPTLPCEYIYLIRIRAAVHYDISFH